MIILSKKLGLLQTQQAITNHVSPVNQLQRVMWKAKRKRMRWKGPVALSPFGALPRSLSLNRRRTRAKWCSFHPYYWLLSCKVVYREFYLRGQSSSQEITTSDAESSPILWGHCPHAGEVWIHRFCYLWNHPFFQRMTHHFSFILDTTRVQIECLSQLVLKWLTCWPKKINI